ncbi:[protein-PII] uridylyltransferase [Variovorax sp. J22G21]|uniref:[protein-PII] uridylyltransferase n=1 Tax=Variovorax fucosicus TaxID=3053517 RepID=UPI0025772334|nr:MULTISPECIES: [protein-PII] uridylyltransferase [unclassified Variovorax]MDM0041362.1 [protein-PII] uridylyltransferase [Variovorax sp. J22R193]MDM0060419.1 [protein-PII] uridylyltransferase [Variovorax sp. J22G21]
MIEAATVDVPMLRDAYRAHKMALFDTLRFARAPTRSVHAVLRQLAALADETLCALWNDAGFGNEFALVAVGGFGRGELFPYSDVDVLLLLPEPHPGEVAPERIEAFIGHCWDAGLEIGSSVRTVDECLAEGAKDVTVQTSLLEARLVTGDKKLYAAFRKRFLAGIDPQAFFAAKSQEMRHRHQKFENTPYALEPNCKESPGGLRDLQAILWMTKAAGFGQRWDDLAKNGLATAFEVQQIKRNEALLSLIRARLHVIAHRREDRLVFDLQNAVAATFGYEGESQRKASEALMRRYYWAAKAVSQLSHILLLNISERLQPLGEEPVRINDRFFEKAGLIEVQSDDLYLRDPHAILETFLLYQKTIGVKGLSARTLRALYNARHVMDSKFRNDRVNHVTFMRMLLEPRGITHAFRLMNETSVLGRYLRVFRSIVGQMQHDLFHVYTVDQHILMVLRNVRRFFIAEHAHEYPFCSQLAAGWNKPWILYVAALFHDIAKGRGGDHSRLGALDVRRFCRQHEIEREDTRLIEFLVAEHLTMSTVAQKQDLSDPEVIGAFAKRVGSERYLTALYLLTIADIRGTSPRVWNAWKGKLLEDLYKATLRTLGGSMPDASAEIEARKRDALVQLALHAQPTDAHKALWDTLDVGYFMRHDAGEIAWHAKQLSRRVPLPGVPIDPKAAALVRARLSPVGEGLQVVVYTPDQAELFARICGYFDQASFSILDAKVHTTTNGYALDTFQVITTFIPEHYRDLISMVESGLSKTLDEAGALPAPSKGRVSRRVRSFPIKPRISLLPDEKAQRWLLNISASDRAGLLYSVARVLARHNLSLQLAKVTTLGERVEDTFLISGPELQGQRAQLAIETELLEALAP